MVKLQKACRNYVTWKAKHSVELKPWLFPEQNSLPRLNPTDIGKWDLTASPVLDEREAVEVVAVSDGADEDDSSGVLMGSEEQLSAANEATNDIQRSTVEQITTDVSLAAAQPATPDTAVAAGANWLQNP